MGNLLTIVVVIAIIGAYFFVKRLEKENEARDRADLHDALQRDIAVDDKKEQQG